MGHPRGPLTIPETRPNYDGDHSRPERTSTAGMARWATTPAVLHHGSGATGETGTASGPAWAVPGPRAPGTPAATRHPSDRRETRQRVPAGPPADGRATARVWSSLTNPFPRATSASLGPVMAHDTVRPSMTTLGRLTIFPSWIEGCRSILQGEPRLLMPDPTPRKTRWPIDKLKNWTSNPRELKREELDRLKKQIKELGEYKPLLITDGRHSAWWQLTAESLP
jgi:hypothetical protein